jgi:hypothetical protein
MTESGLFAAPAVPYPAHSRASTVEERLDSLADLAKEATQLAGRVRTNLESVTKSAVAGKVGSAQSQIQKLSEAVAELSAKAEALAGAECSLGLRGEQASIVDFERELESQLIKKGVTVTKGPDPYWLVYPAWFKVERNKKGSVEIILNGDRVDSLRPSEVAARVAEVVNEKFQPKKFADVLVAVRQLLRRAGAANSTLALDDVYEVLALDGGLSTARKKDFTKADFYYSVHRLAEELEQSSSPALGFPGANRSESMFFTKDGESRKYLTVEFAGAGIR